MSDVYPLYSNIILGKDTDLPEGWTRRMNSVLESLAYAIAEKHPEWTITTHWEPALYDTKTYETREMNVSVTATEESIGQIGIETRRKRGESGKEVIYSIYNKRISESRERGSTFKTAKLKDALKQINKFFYPKTLIDKIEEAWGRASYTVGSATSQASSEVERAYRKLMEPGIRFLKDKYWEEFKSTLTIPAMATLHEQLDDLIEKANDLEKIHQKFQQRNLLTVTIKGDKYTVAKSPTEIKDYLADDVPEDIRKQVGMLKLVADQEIIPGVGLRVGEMYIIDAAY